MEEARMGVYVGFDVGSVSAKLAAVCLPAEGEVSPGRVEVPGFFRASTAAEHIADACVLLSQYRRTFGNPVQTVMELLAELRAILPSGVPLHIRVTGSGGRLVAEALKARPENEFKAIACAVGQIYPDARTVFEIGGESSKYLRLAEETVEGQATGCNGNTYATGIADYSTSGECAAGTGSFLDQQATRLKYRVEEIGDVVSQAKCAARIAGRCSVFAKSDMIHAQQKGFSTEEVLKGLCEAVARNFKSNIVRGKPVVPRVVLIGAVSQNRGVVQALLEAFRLSPDHLFVPGEHAWMGALGCALLERSQHKEPEKRRTLAVSGNGWHPVEKQGNLPNLSLKNVWLLRNHPEASRTAPMPGNGEQIPTYLGIDVGSVSTNLALLDAEGRLLHGIYLRTAGRPIEVVQEGLQEIDSLFHGKIVVCGVGTTGSGRELIGELVGADTVNDEITAHKTGAVFVHQRLVKGKAAAILGSDDDIGDVDTIFEIGGQDSKFISIDHGVVVDFAMNEACAAGTGSFLEEQAERMSIQIKDEFASCALASLAPGRLGERCTVFMERDVTAWMQRGASIKDLAAGLAYSVALNYLNRVVRGRKIGNVIYFQGGTAYNDSVAAAFSQILGKRIIVPPHNGIIGAIGMALIAQEVTRAREEVREQSSVETFASAAAGAGTSGPGTMTMARRAATISTFRGFDLNKASFQTREFVCKACSNYCDMKEITVEGRKTYWGDKCSDKFRKRAKTERKPVITDLMGLRDQLLLEGFEKTNGTSSSGKLRVGMPQAMYFYDRFPFWRTYLEQIGFEIVLGGPTDQRIATRGAELSIAEPCFPVQIAHGHIHSLLLGTELRAPVDYVFVPNVMDMEAPESPVASHLCPWNQTLPFVVRSAPEFEPFASRFLAPTLHFRAGEKHIKNQLAHYFERFGVSRGESNRAANAAYAAQSRFTERLIEEGRAACATLRATGEPSVLLLGRPYNIYDRSGNCDIPRKLRDLYGVNVLPLDFLALDQRDVHDLHPNMFWNSGRRILEAGRFAREFKSMHMIYITNFKCGPDSFIKHFLRDVAEMPFLVLQFDGHGNDAGYLTRCEAYLDSKGLLRCSSTN
jgi:predicted CoA-substrate-specific enzyme activase